MTPFESPVVPDVYKIFAKSSDEDAAVRLFTSS